MTLYAVEGCNRAAPEAEKDRRGLPGGYIQIVKSQSPPEGRAESITRADGDDGKQAGR